VDDRVLLQQALEALEQYTDVVISVNDPNSWITVADGGKPAREVITALRERLAQPEPVSLEIAVGTAYKTGWEHGKSVEREACAKLCEEYRDEWLKGLGRYEFMGEGADYLADFIRARRTDDLP
jgi:hypothetical protein